MDCSLGEVKFSGAPEDKAQIWEETHDPESSGNTRSFLLN